MATFLDVFDLRRHASDNWPPRPLLVACWRLDAAGRLECVWRTENSSDSS